MDRYTDKVSSRRYWLIAVVAYMLGLGVAARLGVGLDYVVITLSLIAWVASGYFVTTWGYFIIRAKSRAKVTWTGILDFGGLQLMVFVYTTLALVSIIDGGVPPAEGWNALIRRTVLYSIITLLSVLRAVHWISYQRRAGRTVPGDVYPNSAS